MGTRLELQTLLEETLGSDKVYFQPPPNFMLSYPCIIFSRSNIRSKHGDNLPYKLDNQYMITVIYSDPDSDIPHKVALLPQCAFDRNYRSDNLNHDVFNILF